MAATELDPMFVKALRLLHSKSKDSAEQLKQMLDDVRNQRKGQKSSSSSEIKESKSSKKNTEEERSKKREAEKRSIDKVKQETSSDPIDELPVIKKVKKESPRPHGSPSRNEESKLKVDSKQEYSEKSRKERDDREKSKKDGEKKSKHDREKEREKEKMRVKEEVTLKKEDSEDDMNAEDFAFDLGIACVVCNLFDVKSGNQLVECQECHHLYHQECHKPPVTEQDVHDPRFVWYCHRCTKSLKKIYHCIMGNNCAGKNAVQEDAEVDNAQTQTQASGSKPGKSKPSGSEETRVKQQSQPPSTSSNTGGGNISSSKPPKTDTSPGSLFFRRVDNKGPSNKDSSTGSAGAKPLSGLASLAANLSGKTDQSKTVKPDVTQKPRSDQSRNSFGKTDQSDKTPLLSVSKAKQEGQRPPGRTELEASNKITTKSADPQRPMGKPVSDQGKSNVKLSSGSMKQTQGGASSVVNAEKRLQMMKKKAAERRTSLK